MQYDHVYDSGVRRWEAEYPIDRERDLPVTVLFEREQIVLTADADGNAVFHRSDGTELLTAKADGSQRRFSSIYCGVTGSAPSVRFPIKETVDHYPNCDGEYDRWSEVIVDNVVITCPL